ncbi:hypothetical protein EPUS_08126 [Endocarpon pusillum Z07020]|uniref:F-actin-capping protein subunit alpha n=1 Tax=Endocarpon pusillum (strain Z07020 / HMAS-L-300199) TaxID=1263415 RepID=U1GP53_ENDPU|nr:uncharacterized protein EPUS_08126 [Endocarpon pusillum Z07020]ERF74078.1 hypothetical protein EPUS_08126 [Endocarpon pusillum Z07020]
MSSTTEIASSFIQDAPPGELQDVVKDIQSLTSDTDPFLLSRLKPAFQKYNEEQLATAELPARTEPVRSIFSPSSCGHYTDMSSAKVIISKYNRLPDGRYFDSESNTSFDFDHVTQKASNPQPYTHPSPHRDLIASLQMCISNYAHEHYASPATGVYPTTAPSDSDSDPDPDSNSSTLALLLVSNRYSPSNFWSGRWRSTYVFSPRTHDHHGALLRRRQRQPDHAQARARGPLRTTGILLLRPGHPPRRKRRIRSR